MSDIYDQLLDETADAAPQPQQPEQATTDVYDTLLNDYQAAENKRLQTSLDQALKVLPEKAATVQGLSKATGLPMDLVERNFDAVHKQVRVRELQSVLADSPILARQMADPQFAALAQNDIETLSIFERAGRQFTGGAVEMVGRTVSGIGELGDVVQRGIIRGLSSALLPQPRGGGDMPTLESLTGPLIGEGWRVAGDLAKDFARDDLMIPQLQQTFTDQVFAGLGQAGGQVLAQLLTGGATNAVSMYAQGADIMAEATANDPASQGWKDLATLGGAAVTGLTEKWAFDRLMGPLSTPIKNKIGAAVTRIGIAGASEGVQEMAENLAHESLRKMLTNPDAEISLGNALDEGAVGGTVGVIVRTIVEAGLGVRVRQAQREVNAANAERNVQIVEDLTTAARASDLLKNSPEAFAQFINEANADGPVQDIFIDGKTLMQSGFAEELAQVSPSVAEQLQTAAATGGTVQIPLAEYLSKIAPTDYAQGLLDHIKTDPEHSTRAELREYNQSGAAAELEAEFEQTVNAAVDEQTEFKASQERVKQTVLDELNALGRFTPGKNEFDATLIATRIATRAAQLGTTPEALFARESQRLKFAAERIDGDQFDQQGNLQTDTEAFRNWFSDSKVVDAEGEPLVVYRGLGAPYEQGAEREITWVTPDAGYASQYAEGNATPVADNGRIYDTGANVLPLYVSINRPFDLGFRSTKTSVKYSDVLDRIDGGVQSAFEREVIGRDEAIALIREIKDLKKQDTGEFKKVHEWWTQNAEQVKGLLERAGYDGIKSREGFDDRIPAFGAFRPEQIKSAIGNRGTFDPNDPNILNQSAQDGAGFTPPAEAETGKPMRVYFARNTVSSKANAPAGMDFGQGIEPAGEYMVIQDSDMADASAGWEFGTITFRNPLVLEHKNTGSTGWKKDLSDMFDGKTGRALSDAVKKAGYDGIVTLDENGYSETVNLSGSKIDPNRNLYVAHNITGEGILAANELGGLAAPSIAVARADIGFDNFGEVTLIADPSLLTSPKVRTFDADVYSPRQPRAEFELDDKKWNAFAKTLDPERLGLREPDINSAEREGPQALAESDAVRYKFLQEQGKLPKMKAIKADAAVKKVAKMPGFVYELTEDPKVIAIAQKYYEDQAATLTEAAEGDPRRAALYRNMYFDEAGAVKSSLVREFVNEAVQYRSNGGKDTRQFQSDLRAKLRDGKLAKEYQDWVQNLFGEMAQSKRLFKGFNNAGDRKYVPYTLENVVREMTQTLQAGEGYFYGAGSVRSAVANEMRTIGQVQARRGQIVTAAEFEPLKEESNQKLTDALDALRPFYKYDADGWGYADDAGAALTEGPKGIREAFRITPESQAIIDDLLGYLRDMPTVYFEAKAQRAVQFSEFNTAVVPKGLRKDALQVLKDAGLKIKTYDPKTEGARAQVVAAQTNLLFQNQRAPRGAFNPETVTLALLRGADLSTFLHEAGHYFFEADIALAAELVQEARIFGEERLSDGERQLLRDVSTLMNWHGVQGDIQQQLDQWFNMGFEEKRVAHERTAESFEVYLFEGKAPSIEMQPYFQQFRAWLVNVYRSITDFLKRNPEAGKLNDDVRAVFDRMLATNDQIKLAEQGRSMMPLFRTEGDAANIGMTPQEFEAYQRTDVEASAEAIQEVQQRGLRDLQWMRNARSREIVKLRRQSKELRREVQMDVRREVMSQPVYRAWQFLTARINPEDKINPVERRKSDPNVVDPTLDSLFVAVAKLGGLNKQSAMEQWGIDPAEKPQSGVFGKPVLRAGAEGLTVDGMAEALGELGYLTLDENGKPNASDLEALFGDELRGDKVYSNQVDFEALNPPPPGTVADIDQLTAGRLDMGALYEMDVDDAQVKLLQARRMTARDGIHPDLLAPLFGFNSGQEMIDALAEANPPRDEIDGLTDARMLEQYGELATPEAIEREADKAIHNEARARMVATEANALARATGRRQILTTAAKQFAQTMVARLRIRDVRPAQYTSAGVRAGKAAEKASKAGNLDVAGAEKRSQLVNIYAAKAAYDAQEEIAKGVRYLKKFDSAGVRKNLDAGFMDQIDAILERFDLRAGQSLKAIDKRTSLANWIAEQEAEGFEPDIPEYLRAEANRTHYRNLTVEEFRGVIASVQQIEHIARLKKRLLTAKKKRELDAIVGEIEAQIEESSGGRVVDNERRNTARSWASHLGRGLLAVHRKAASVIREMDGFKDGGPFWEYFTRSMNEKSDWEVQARADASAKLYELAKPILAGEKMGGNGVFFPTLGRHLNRGERLAIALNWGNEANRQRLTGGRGWTDAQLDPVLATLTAQDWTFVQGVWDFFESYRPEIGAKERRVYGKEPEWVEPMPFTVRTADGQVVQMRGGYYPIKYDPRQSGKAGQHAKAEDAKAMMRAAYTAATTRRSFTKTRAEEVHGRPLLLTFDGIWQGANEVIHDLAWHEWLIDANRLLGKLDSSIRTHYGAETVDVLTDAVEAIARGDQPATNALEKSLQHLRNGTTVVGMGWNITTALLQPFGITNSIVRVGGSWIAKGLGQFYGSPSHMMEVSRSVQARSQFMADRARTMNREINDVRNQLEVGKGEIRTAIEATHFLLIQKLQAAVDYPTWLGAYEKAIADPANLNPDGTIDEARAVALADQAVIDSQGGGTTKDLAQVQRGHPVMKLFTNFYSYFSVLLNLTYERTANTDFRKPKEVGALMNDYLLLIIVPAVLSAILRNALKGEDDEDEYLKAMASEIVGYPFGMFVGLREVAGAAQLAAGVGNPAFGYSGPAGLRFFSEVNKLGQQVGQGDVDMALFKAANNVGGILFHYPAGQVNRLVDGTAALIEGRTENPLAPLVGAPYR